MRLIGMVDTDIFNAVKFNLCDNGTIRLLEYYVKNVKIKVVMRYCCTGIKKTCWRSSQKYVKLCEK